jgi:signal transduction histidine kinase
MEQSGENLKRVQDPQIFNLSYLVLAVLILLTIGITYNFYKSAQTKDSIRFNNQVNRLNSSIENKINLYVALIKGSRGFIEATPELSRQKFADYIERLDLQNKYTGIQGIGFSKIVKPSERAALIEKMQSEGFPDFKIHPDFERDSYQTVIFLEPLNAVNRAAIGFDMSTEPVRRDAMEQARNTSNAAASAQVKLTQETGEIQTGFFIYLPVYAKSEKSEIPDIQEKGNENLVGFVYSPIRSDHFLNEIYQNTPDRDINIKIYDGETNPSNLLAQTENKNLKKIDFADIGSVDFDNITDEKYQTHNELNVAGRTWIIEYNALPSFMEQSSVSWTPLILLCGFAFSFMLFGMTYWEAAARAQVEKTAAELLVVQKQREVLLVNEREARLAAEQSNATKDEFIAIVSHELKTPLNAIAGWARILKNKEIPGNTRELALRKIDKNLRAQASLVEQLLSYSDIISGKTNVQKEKFDFSEVFDEVYESVKPLANEKNIELSKMNESNDSIIFGDKEKLKIVFHNLLTNAVKFTQNGGRVEAALSRVNEEIQLTVKDNGRGIGGDFLPFVFERYKQADNPNTRDYGGLGLGLTISKHIVALHQGKITAQSAGKGKGAVFTMSIPVNQGN